MPTLGPNFAAVESEVGSGEAWSATTAARGAADGAFDTGSVAWLSGGAATTKTLYLRGFDFAVPDLATINGITVAVTQKSNGSTFATHHCTLYANSVAIGTAKATTPGMSLAAETLGGVSDTWGALLSPTIVNRSDFGVGIYTQTLDPIEDDYDIDAVSVTVTYTAAVATTATTNAPAMMRNTCTIKRGTNTQSSYGTAIKTYATLTTGVQCSVQEISGSEGTFQERLQGYRMFEVFLPAGTDIVASDRITTISGVLGMDGTEVLEVKSPPVDNAGRGAYIVVTATEMNA